MLCFRRGLWVSQSYSRQKRKIFCNTLRWDIFALKCGIVLNVAKIRFYITLLFANPSPPHIHKFLISHQMHWYNCKMFITSQTQRQVKPWISSLRFIIHLHAITCRKIHFSENAHCYMLCCGRSTCAILLRHFMWHLCLSFGSNL